MTTTDDSTTDEQPTSTGSNLKRSAEGGYHPLSPEQCETLTAVRGEAGDGLVIGEAGSGSGKTTQSIECLGDHLWRTLDETGELPEGAAVVTFTRTAARDLREEAERRLADHVTACAEQGIHDDPIATRWDEVREWLYHEADIRTLDSLTLDWYEQLASASELPSNISVEDAAAHQRTLQRIEQDLAQSGEFRGAIRILERRFGDGGDTEGPAPWLIEVFKALETGRQYCQGVAWLSSTLRANVDRCFGGGRPDSPDRLREAVRTLGREDVLVNDEWADYAATAYDTTRVLVEAFCELLAAFEAKYDELTFTTGTFTHTDVTYIVTKLLEGDADFPVDVPHIEAFREQLLRAYPLVIIDESQDNSYGQLQVLKHLFDASMADTEGLYVGDLKQSIYTWRVAEPALFAELIGVDGSPDGSILGVDNVVVQRLSDSFRHHPHIIDFVNATFPDIFEDPARGNLGQFEVPYHPLRARRYESEPEKPHIHVVKIPEDATKRKDRVAVEAELFARRLRGAVDQQAEDAENGALNVDPGPTMAAVDEEGFVDRRTPMTDEPTLKPASEGQNVFLFRGMFHAPTFAKELDKMGFRTAILSGTSLFETPEVQLLEGLLRVVASYDSPEAIRWLSKSPFTTLGEEMAAVLEYADFDLETALEAVEEEQNALTGDSSSSTSPPWSEETLTAVELEHVAAQVTELIRLGDLLKTHRHGPKADLLRKLIRETGFESTVLASSSGFQRSANIDRLVDIVADWEAEQPLELTDLLATMRTCRESDTVGPDAALTADAYSQDTVLLMSVHYAKGKEFDNVYMPDLYWKIDGSPIANEDWLTDRELGMALRPWTDGATRPDTAVGTEYDTFWTADETGDFEDYGHTWPAEHRTPVPTGDLDAGSYLPDHPFQPVVGDRRAEEFRTLYVALTRSCDHLVLGLQDGRTDPVYSSWGDTLYDALDLGRSDPNGVHILEYTDEAGAHRQIPIGIDDLPLADSGRTPRFTPESRRRAGVYRKNHVQEQEQELEMSPVTLPETPAASETENRVRPRTLSPSGLSVVLDDVSGAFRAVCPDVTVDSHGATQGSTLPPGLSEQEWGDIVHALVEAVADTEWDPATDLTIDSRAADLVEATLDDVLPKAHGSRVDARRTLQREVLPALADTVTFADLQSSSARLAERPTGAIFREGDRPLFARGRLDVLYRSDGGWWLCDIKTGRPPRGRSYGALAGSEKFAGYGIQLALYAWLLESEYDIRLEGVRLTYLWPTQVEFGLTVDTDAVPSILSDIIAGRSTESLRQEVSDR